jgi:hypothetical protein
MTAHTEQPVRPHAGARMVASLGLALHTLTAICATVKTLLRSTTQ